MTGDESGRIAGRMAETMRQLIRGTHTFFFLWRSCVQFDWTSLAKYFECAQHLQKSRSTSLAISGGGGGGVRDYSGLRAKLRVSNWPHNLHGYSRGFRELFLYSHTLSALFLVVVGRYCGHLFCLLVSEKLVVVEKVCGLCSRENKAAAFYSVFSL